LFALSCSIAFFLLAVFVRQWRRADYISEKSVSPRTAARLCSNCARGGGFAMGYNPTSDDGVIPPTAPRNMMTSLIASFEVKKTKQFLQITLRILLFDLIGLTLLSSFVGVGLDKQ
jgi:hypothetical protein